MYRQYSVDHIGMMLSNAHKHLWAFQEDIATRSCQINLIIEKVLEKGKI